MRNGLILGLGFLIGIFVVFMFLVVSPDLGKSRYRREVVGSIRNSAADIGFINSSPSNDLAICAKIAGALHWSARRLSEAALSQDLALHRGSIAVAVENRWAEKARREKISIGLFGVSDDELTAAHSAISESHAVVKDGHRLAELMIACGVWKDE